MKKTALPSRRRFIKPILYITGFLVVWLIAGYFIANSVIRKKVDEALRALPPSLQVQYRSLQANVLTGSLDLEGVNARYMPDQGHGQEVDVERITISGFSVLAWLRAHQVRIRNIRVDSVAVHIDEDLLAKDSGWKRLTSPAMDALINNMEVEGLTVEVMRHGRRQLVAHGSLRLDSVTSGAIGAIRFLATDAVYSVPDMEETIRLHRLELDSKNRLARLDSLEIAPDMNKEEIGRSKGHQVDVVRGALEGIEVKGLDVPGLVNGRLDADQISLRKSRIHVFRDRRLPLEAGDKPMPVAGLESLPIELRVGKVKLGTTRFEYEEYPKDGLKPGTLVIEGLHGTMEPLLNKPRKGDPAFMTVTTEGSLMGSGIVTATTRMPLHKNAFYEVEGAFHDLDVTRLNNPAENLGQLHLESGMLNQLDFHFEMGEERATGKIVGVYHDLVADKLKEKNGQLKTAALKSFALKKLIIPRDKDKSLPVEKRTGKVDYKRDKQRYFSYYLLHSLLVGVKSSFSLGFLLPG